MTEHNNSKPFFKKLNMPQLFVIYMNPNKTKFYLGNVNGKHFRKFFKIFGGVNLLFSELWHILIKVR
jgi:hypothetical protein